MDNACYSDSETDSEESFCDCENMPDTRDNRGVSKIYAREQRDKFMNSIPGTSKKTARTPVSPSRNAPKRMRLENRMAKRTNEYDEENIMEEDLDCICDTQIQVNPDAYSGKRLSDRTRVASRNPRNGRSFEDVENKKERQMDNKGNECAEDTEDSMYRELKKRNPRRNRTRKQELKKWIRRCREECARQRPR